MWPSNVTNVRSGRSNAPLLVVYVYVCFVLNFGSVCFIDCWHTIQTIHTHTSTRNTRRGKHAHVTSPFATSPNYAYASSAAGALNKHISIINLHAINAVCMRVFVCVFNVNQPLTPRADPSSLPHTFFDKLREYNIQANCFCHWMRPKEKRGNGPRVGGW